MEKIKYTEEQIDNAVLVTGDGHSRPENIEYELYKEARKQIKLKARLHKLGMLEHISASLIPKLGDDGRIRVPVEWIGKTKGTTYENLEKQKNRKLELFAYYMSKGNNENAQKIVDSIGVIDDKMYRNSPEYKQQIREKEEVEKTRKSLEKQTRILKARSSGK